ncbi:Hypothetical protein I596_717 [Dokdonella koreensis DS-123]|uniref:Uncharacterized protein n=1 Tax=Dokdonella koreensis DS-123 TaxID=1300342 RepID=A0A160DT68_9GAMM|nr:Hypothetical protein I596_717 [Dokdonella koreensis DS-123]
MIDTIKIDQCIRWCQISPRPITGERPDAAGCRPVPLESRPRNHR